MARNYCTFQPLLLLIIVLSPSSAWKFGGGIKSTTGSAVINSKSSSSLQALDEELAELAELIRLQTTKLRLLEAYRRHVAAGAIEGEGRDTKTSQCMEPVFEPSTLSLSGSSNGGTGNALAEDYLVRLAALPGTGNMKGGTESTEAGKNSRVTAVKLLTLQRARGKAAPRGSHMQFSKAVNVLVVARADTADNTKAGKRSDDSIASNISRRASSLYFYDLKGQLLSQYTPVGHSSAAITSIAFEAVDGEDALMVTGGRDGSLSLHNVQLWKDGKIIAGRRKILSSESFSSPPFFAVPPNITSSDGFGMQIAHEATLLPLDAQTKEDVSALPPPVKAKTKEGISALQPPVKAREIAATSAGSPVLSALLYQHRSYGWLVFSGDAAGNIQCHFRNGTLFKAIDTGHPVYALIRNGKTLLYTADRDVHFLSAMTLEPYRTAYCLGRHGPLISLAWDSFSPQVLHASSAQGDILSFDTSPPHARRGHPYQQQQPMYGGAAAEGNCALLKKLASRTGGSAPVSLATVPGGYLLAVSMRGNIFAYNTTGLRDTASPLPLVFQLKFPPPPALSKEEESPRIIFSTNGGGAGSSSRISPTFVVYMGLGTSGNPLIDKHASLRDDGGQLVLFEAILPYRRPKGLEFNWIRLPLICLALGLVFWHFSKERRGKRLGLAMNPIQEGAQLGNIGLRPSGRRMYDLMEEDEDGQEEREDEPGWRAGADDDDEQNRQLRGLLRARQARNFAF